MKQFKMLILGLMAGVFFSSCASYEKSQPSHVPPEKKPSVAISKERSRPEGELPQIGARQASVPREKFQPEILHTLKKRAAQQIQAYKLDAAVVTLEQALGIDAQDPLLWHLMARVKLAQKNLQQAEHLAKKSNIFAANDPALQKKNWDIIAESLDLQGKISEAEAARKKVQE